MSDAVEVKFGVKLDGLFSGLASAQSALKDSTSAMRGSLDDLGAGFSKLQGVMVGFTAILGGGALFASSISAAKQLAGEATGLAKSLGVTTTDASVLNVALRSVGLSADTYTGASQKLTRQLKTNEDGLKAMGVVTRDANGQLLNGQAIMTSAVSALSQYKEGTDRNLAAQNLFGRGAAEATALMKLNNEVMEKAKLRAEELGLVIGPNQAGGLKAYKDAMADVSLVLTGIQNVIGQALMPVLTELAQFFSATGPARVNIMRIAMSLIVDVFRIVIDIAMELKNTISNVFSAFGDAVSGGAGKGLTAMQFFANICAVVKIAILTMELAVVTAFEIIGGSIETVIAYIKAYGNIVKAVFVDQDWGAVKSAWVSGTQEIERIINASAQRISKKTSEIGEQMALAANGKSISPEKQYELKAPSATGKNFTDEKQDASKDPKQKSQIAVWEAVNNADKAHYEMANNLKLRDLAEDVDYWTKKAALATTSADDKIKATAKAAAAELSVMKKQTADGKALSEELVAQYEKSATDSLSIQKVKNDTDFALGKINNARLIQLDMQIEDERLAIQQAASALRLQLIEQDPNHSPAALQKEKDALLNIERSYELKKLNLSKESSIESNKNSKQFEDGMTSGFAGVLKSFASGSMSIQNLFKNMGKVILDSMIGVFAQMAAKWLATQIMNAVVGKTAAVSEITSQAGVAGAAAVASTAAIPVVGPGLAPAAGLAASAAAMGFMSLASARNGFDIPAGLNPITQLHENEMVLPQAQADAVRDMASGGGAGGAVNLHVHATDSQSVARLFRENGEHIVAALQKQRRNLATGM